MGYFKRLYQVPGEKSKHASEQRKLEALHRDVAARRARIRPTPKQGPNVPTPPWLDPPSADGQLSLF